LVERRQQVFARTPFAVWTGPHVITRLGGNDQFVAPLAKVFAHNAAESFLRRAVRRTVVVRQIKMRDAQIKRATNYRAGVLKRILRAEIMPEAERDQREPDAGASAAAVKIWRIVAGGGGRIHDGFSLIEGRGRFD
jgi:hypothetical protein